MLGVKTATLPVLVTQSSTVSTTQPVPLTDNSNNFPTATSSPTPRTTNTPVSIVTPTDIPVTFFDLSTCDILTPLDDLSIPDGMWMKPGEVFVKSWRLKNSGTCDWTQGYTLAFWLGDRMGAPSQVKPYFYLPDDPAILEPGTWPIRHYQVSPDQTIDLSLAFRAPEEPGNYIGNWVLINHEGKRVEAPFWVMINVEDTPKNEDDFWTGEWLIRDPYAETTAYVQLYLSQSDSQVKGFFYNAFGDIVLLDSWIQPDNLLLKGEYGTASGGAPTPFQWKLMENKKQFQGVVNKGGRLVGPLCGSKIGLSLPDTCVIELETNG